MTPLQQAVAASGHAASRLISYDTSLHGTPLFEHDSELLDEVMRWLLETLRSR